MRADITGDSNATNIITFGGRVANNNIDLLNYRSSNYGVVTEDYKLILEYTKSTDQGGNA